MKKLTLPLLLALFACQPSGTNSFSDNDDQRQKDPLAGAWKMTRYMEVSNAGDTLSDDRVQYKMYADGSVMWGFEAPARYTEYFGYGTYAVDGDSLYENMTSGSWAFRQAISGGKNFFRIGIKIEEDTYTQVIKDDSATYYETYMRIN